MFKRKIYDKLLEWKETSKGRTALLIEGARRVGKSTIVTEFGKNEYKSYILIDFAFAPTGVKELFNDISDLDYLFLQLQLQFKADLHERNSLIIFDEVQFCPKARQAVKKLVEDGRYDYIETGSLISIKKNVEHILIPSEERKIEMFPMDFEEFLWAMDRSLLGSEIKDHFNKNEKMPAPFHEEAMGIFKQFLIIGGMPAVINEFIDSGSYLTVRDVQGKIQNEYVADMAKYATPATAVKIRACYNSIPAQLAKENVKFQYKTVQRGGTAAIFGESIEWLVYAGAALKCQKTSHGFMPVSAYVNLSDFKLYMNDAGLLTMKSGMAVQTILSTLEEDNMFLGMISENYVAQTLVCNGFPLYYWKNENTAELDFVIQQAGEVVPVEVKKGRRTKSISFNLFMKQYKSKSGIRISGKNFGFENNIRSVPLYAVWCIHPE